MHPDAAAEIKIQVCFKQPLFGKKPRHNFQFGTLSRISANCPQYPPSSGNHQLIFNFGITAVTDYFFNFTLFYFTLFNAILSTVCGKLEDRF